MPQGLALHAAFPYLSSDFLVNDVRVHVCEIV
jgi:hypothetical protein